MAGRCSSFAKMPLPISAMPVAIVLDVVKVLLLVV
jgi:hypothetical protein